MIGPLGSCSRARAAILNRRTIPTVAGFSLVTNRQSSSANNITLFTSSSSHTEISSATDALNSQTNGWPSGWMCHLFQAIHDNFHTPWWAAIVAVPLIIKVSSLPIHIRNYGISLRARRHYPETVKLTARVKDLSCIPAHEAERMKALQQLKLHYKKHDIHPAKMLGGPILLTSLTIPGFLAVRKMVDQVPQLAAEGMAWIPSLAAYDPYYILPITSLCMTLTSQFVSILIFDGIYFFATRNNMLFSSNLQIANNNSPNNPSWMPTILYTMTIGFCWITLNFPAGLNLFILTNSTSNLIQSAAFRSNLIGRKLLKFDLDALHINSRTVDMTKTIGYFSSNQTTSNKSESQLLTSTTKPMGIRESMNFFMAEMKKNTNQITNPMGSVMKNVSPEMKKSASVTSSSGISISKI